MINPFSILSFLYTIGKDTPDPVNVQYEPPSPNLLPVEFHKKIKTDGFFTSQLWIENLSKKVLENVRINLTSPLEYDPIVRTSKPHGEIEYKYIQKTHELVIDKIDPNEAIRMTFFPKVDEVNNFNKPQILVSNIELSKLMEKLGLYKKYPSLLSMYLILIISVVATICAVSFAGYALLQDNEYFFPNSDAVLMKKAQNRMKDYSCPQRVGLVTEELTKQVKSTFGYPKAILKINGVDSESELWKQEKIVFIDCG